MSQPNRRHGERVIFERGFKTAMMGIDGTWRRDCTMHDMSETGAKLSVEAGALAGLDISEFFLLLTSSGGVNRRCEKAWVNGNEIGAKFSVKSPVPAKNRRSVSTSQSAGRSVEK
jgi:hypothetical protein